MPKIEYVIPRFRAASLERIAQANQIIAEYDEQGFNLTLRQLYYQFISRDLLPNTVQSYKALGSLISDARLAGLIDWNDITDRTRHLRSQSHWSSPHSIIRSAASSYALDKWENQPCRVEVWIEKDALLGVFEPICQQLDLPLFSCRGYASQSEVWAAGQRLLGIIRDKQKPIILYFGDHDPSGLDMTRDIRERLALFAGRAIEVRRLALTMDQVEEYSPPPNPAKETDARFAAYQDEFGDESWELDALAPPVLAALVQDQVGALRDINHWNQTVNDEAEERGLLQSASDRWDEVVEFLESQTEGEED